MKRVKQGEKYWILLMDQYGIYPLGHHRDYRYQTDDLFFEQGNYFHTKDEAEACANKIAAVLKGADVIEGGCIVIHTERCSDAQTEEISDAIAGFLTEKFPDYAKTILN